MFEANHKKYYGFISLCVFATGCALTTEQAIPLAQSASSGRIGCQPSQIQITDYQGGFQTNARSWNALCSGKKFTCSAIASYGKWNEVSCLQIVSGGEIITKPVNSGVVLNKQPKSKNIIADRKNIDIVVNDFFGAGSEGHAESIDGKHFVFDSKNKNVWTLVEYSKKKNRPICMQNLKSFGSDENWFSVDKAKKGKCQTNAANAD